MANNTQTFNVSFPKELVAKMDEVAKKRFGSRSDLLRTAALEYIRKEQESEQRYEDTRPTASDREATDVANSLLERYKQDFSNLAQR